MRMKNVMSLTVVVLLLFGTMSSCKKDGQIGIGSGDEIWRNITFRINSFKTQIKPMMANTSLRGWVANDPHKLQSANGNVAVSPEFQWLYLWTFNKESLVPDIGIDTMAASIKVITEN